MSNRAYIEYLSSVSDSILYIPLYVTLPIGIIGNLFSIYIYTKPALNNKTNTGFLYAFLCLANLVLMTYFMFVTLSLQLFGYVVNLPCGGKLYLLRAVYCFVPWMQVVICFDRFIVVVFPVAKSKFNKKVFFVIITAVVALIFIANMASLFSYPVTVIRQGQVRVNCVISDEANVTANMFATAWSIYLPFVIMLVLNIVIFKRLKQSKSRVAVVNIGNNGKKSPELNNKQRRFIISTIFIDLVFLLFYTPTAVFVSINIDFIIDPSGWDSLSRTILILYRELSLLLLFLYSVVTVFILVIFNRYFRFEVIALFRLNRLFPDLAQADSNTGSVANRTFFKKKMTTIQ